MLLIGCNILCNLTTKGCCAGTQLIISKLLDFRIYLLDLLNVRRNLLTVLIGFTAEEKLYYT